MEKFDELIKEEISEQADLFTIPQDMLERINSRISEEQKESNKSMFRMTKKKVIMLVACAVLIVGCVSIAAGKTETIVSTSSNIPVYSSYSELAKAEEQYGFVTYGPEKFSNGFVFDGVYTTQSEGYDVNDELTNKYEYIYIEYKRDQASVMLDIEPGDILSDNRDNYAMAEVNGIPCYYVTMQNKFVPVEYEPTEEEYKAMEEGTLNIAYGTDEIELSTSLQVFWMQDGNTHSLFYMNENPELTMDDLLEMVKECTGN